MCDHCHTPIRVRDNLPVVGWLLLRGQTRCCWQPIPKRYIFTEAFTALVWAWWLRVFPLGWWMAVALPVSAVLVATIVGDAPRWWRRMRTLDWRAAVAAGAVAFLVRWGLFAAGIETAIDADLGLSVNQAWATIGVIGLAAYGIAAAVWWLIYKRIARPGKLWAKKDDQEGTANRMSGEGCEKPRTQERAGLPGFSEFAPAAQPN